MAIEEPMTETRLSSDKREVVIGFDRRFVMIGERINPTGRKLLAAEMAVVLSGLERADVERMKYGTGRFFLELVIEPYLGEGVR